MSYRYFFIPVAMLTACLRHPPSETGGGGIVFHDDTGGGGGADPCDDGDPCTVDTAQGSRCTHAPEPAGTICEGAAADPIHGECNPDAGTCDVQEWTCLRNPPGTKCIGGICDGHQRCCSGGCINADGFCTFGPPFNGLACNA
jgi:hypothetical protein